MELSHLLCRCPVYTSLLGISWSWHLELRFAVTSLRSLGPVWRQLWAHKDLMICGCWCVLLCVLSALIGKVHLAHDSVLWHSSCWRCCRGVVWEDCNERCPVLLVHQGLLIHTALKLSQTLWVLLAMRGRLKSLLFLKNSYSLDITVGTLVNW